MSNQGLNKQVQKMLRAEEACQCAGEAKFVKSTGKKRARVIAIVSNLAKKREAAIFALKAKRFQQTVIKGIYPITADCTARATSDVTFDVRFGAGETYSFETINQDTMVQLMRHLTASIKNAVEGGLTDASQFKWTQSYTIVEDGDTETANDGDDGPSTPLPGPVSAAAPVEAPAAGNGAAGAGAASEVPPRRSSTTVARATTIDGQPKVDIKEQWIAEQMKARESEFTETCPISIFIGSWNVNGKEPGEKLDKWLLNDKRPALYAIGFQELDLTAGAFVLNNSNRSNAWETEIENTLSRQGRYHRVMSKQLVGILLCVYVKEEHRAHVTDVQADMAGVGIMGMMGNKGGVAIRFKFLDSPMCFVVSHLAARTDNVERRNQDWHEICRRLQFRPSGETPYDIFSHDFLFWAGDLNYRIPRPFAEIVTKINASDWDFLLSHDQLMQQMKAGNTFVGFTEGKIDFCPTYKYDPGTNRFDTSEKKRCPAWCDRILWLNNQNVRQLSYGRHELMTSDHKPVSSVIEAMVKVVIAEQQAAVYHSIVRALDKIDNECLPDASISSSSFAFGPVRFLCPSVQNLEVRNTGQVVIKYSFINKPDDNSANFCQPWLQVHPAGGMIVPGQTATIAITILVDADTAPALNVGSERLEDLLILHLENGKDYFITVNAEYQKSCFAVSLPVLCSLTGPARTSPLTLSKTEASKRPVLSIPKELWLIVDYLFLNGLDEEDLFMESGDQREMAFIRECLDAGTDLRSFRGKIHSVAETLFCFLDSLPEPVIPFRMVQRCIDCANSPAQCQQLVNVLPTLNYNVFIYITAFLREVLAHSKQNNLDGEKLALVFSRVLLREPRSVRSGKSENVAPSRSKIAFVANFLVDDPSAAAEVHRDSDGD